MNANGLLTKLPDHQMIYTTVALPQCWRRCEDCHMYPRKGFIYEVHQAVADGHADLFSYLMDLGVVDPALGWNDLCMYGRRHGQGRAGQTAERLEARIGQQGGQLPARRARAVVP